MTRSRLSLWRRLVGLVLLTGLGLASVEVVWAQASGESDVPAFSHAASTAMVADTAADPGSDSDDCACLCACACANAQQVTPAVLPLSPSPDPIASPESPVVRDRVPRAVSPLPHLRPPIA